MTTITDLIEHIDEFDAEDVIFAKPDWTEHAEARIFRLTEDHRSPPEATALGFRYFLESMSFGRSWRSFAMGQTRRSRRGFVA
ncbi:MAG: hypothetical protein KF782_24560 [Labilithrix sp.]|nr:hypothetical protein [Labilithrix sp.]